jgi:hypothetical protein
MGNILEADGASSIGTEGNASGGRGQISKRIPMRMISRGGTRKYMAAGSEFLPRKS